MKKQIGVCSECGGRVMARAVFSLMRSLGECESCNASAHWFQGVMRMDVASPAPDGKYRAWTGACDHTVAAQPPQ